MKYLIILLTLVLGLSTGCGAHTSRDLGIPISKSESFYFHMKEAALNSGYRATTDKKGDLTIYVSEGSLQYKPNLSQDGLAVTLYTNDHDDESVEIEWLNKLEVIHSQLLADAKALAKTNQAW